MLVNGPVRLRDSRNKEQQKVEMQKKEQVGKLDAE